MSRGHGTIRKRIDFFAGAESALPVTITDASAWSSLANNALLLTVPTTTSQQARITTLPQAIPKADLLTFEALVKISGIDDDSDIRIGVVSADNADPDVIAESAFFKLKGKAGAANAHDLFIETDDGTTDNNEVATNKSVQFGVWTRFRIDFANGTQSISPPGKSKGGFGSVRFSCERESAGNGFMEHIMPAEAGKHMDMDAASGPFSPFIQVRNLAALDAGFTFELREICLEYRNY